MPTTYNFLRKYVKNGEIKTGGVVEKATLWDAEKKFYNTIGTDMEDSEITEEEVIVWFWDDNGGLCVPFSKKWKAPEEESTESSS